MGILEALAHPLELSPEGARSFLVIAVVSLLAAGVLLYLTGQLAVDAWKAMLAEHRAAKIRRRAR